mmetsp:Transcript_1823/g.1539  ORF Transcript_1823/g.1539 Transcript_1823/m.1539 type:complete len:322 (+) Transcript_1823:40-1005(+)
MNYLSLSSIFGTTTTDDTGERDRARTSDRHDGDPRKTTLIGEPPTFSRIKSTPSIRSTLTTAGAPINCTKPTPLSSLTPISTRSRTNSTTSLSSLPSCVSVTSMEQTPGHDGTASVHSDGYPSFITDDQHQSRKKLRKRRASTSTLPYECSGGDTMDETFKIKVTCNNCYLWRKKCLKQEDKLKQLQSELDRVKMNSMELLNKNNLNTKTFILRNKEMNMNLNEYKKQLRELKQLNKDQLNKINDMKHENDALKQENTNLRQENKSLHDDVEETKERGRKALNVINKLKEKVVQIQAQIKSEDSAMVKDAKNPWLWVLRMT